jgi:hypothetical protein
MLVHATSMASSFDNATPRIPTGNSSSGCQRNELTERAGIIGAHVFGTVMEAVGVRDVDLAIAWKCSEELARLRRLGERPLTLGLVLVVMLRIPATRRPLRAALDELFPEAP